MTRNEQWNVVLWTVAIGTAALFIFFAVFFGTGCAPTQEVVEYSKAELTCEMKQAEAIFASSTCNEAQLRVDAVLATEPACRALDAGPYDLCVKYRERQGRDGGADGPH